MSDFLARIVARALGRPAAARPRVSATFEQAEATREAPLEHLDEEAAAPQRAGPVPTEQLPDGDRRRARAATPEAPAPRPGQGARGPEVAPPPSVASPHGEEGGRRGSTTARPAAETSVPRPEISSLPAAAAMPLTPATPEVLSTGEAPPQTPVPREEPGPVRVHIGRLEVRANLQQTAAEQPRRAPPHPEGLSLSDYLRGER